MTKVVILDHSDVEFVEAMGDDTSVVQAAQVSVKGINEGTDSPRLINALMKDRHGSPFEHAALKWFVKAPIFVFREFHRHRIGFSYNEYSGRYSEMLPEFYSPPPDRPLTQTGKAMEYNLSVSEDQDQLWNFKRREDLIQFQAAWDSYDRQLHRGIPREMARTVLPVATMSQMIVTCNPRSLMSFLSLRVRADDATFPSKPQWEINRVADLMESDFKGAFPQIHAAFITNGRVAP